MSEMGLFDFFKRKSEDDPQIRKPQPGLDRIVETYDVVQNATTASSESESKHYQILYFYLDCDWVKAQDKEFEKLPLALPMKVVDVEKDSDIVSKYRVNS